MCGCRRKYGILWAMRECCLDEPGYCQVYRQFMPEPARRLCAGVGVSEAEQEAVRAKWDAEGGPLGLRRGLPVVNGPCRHLGPWTGRLCES